MSRRRGWWYWLVLLAALVLPIRAWAQFGAQPIAPDGIPSATPTPTACPVSPSPTPTPTSTATVSAILFAPAVVMLDNPTTPGTKTQSTSFSVMVTAYDNNGNVLEPSDGDPLSIRIDGAPEGTITPVIKKLKQGDVAKFEYSGKYFPKPINVEAWMKIPNGTPSAGTYALGMTQILGQNTNACAYAAKSVGLVVDCNGDTADQCATDNITSPAGVQVMAAVGYADAKKATFNPYTVDTGSSGRDSADERTA